MISPNRFRCDRWVELIPICLVLWLFAGAPTDYALAGNPTEVIVNVYRLPVVGKALPVYHAGVVVGDTEYFFGDQNKVLTCKPRGASWEFHRSIRRTTRKSSIDVHATLLKTIHEWNGTRYELTSHNCVDFVNDFLRRLELKPIDREYSRNSGFKKLDVVPGVSVLTELGKHSPSVEEAIKEDLKKIERLPQDTKREVSKLWRNIFH